MSRRNQSDIKKLLFIKRSNRYLMLQLVQGECKTMRSGVCSVLTPSRESWHIEIHSNTHTHTHAHLHTHSHIYTHFCKCTLHTPTQYALTHSHKVCVYSKETPLFLSSTSGHAVPGWAAGTQASLKSTNAHTAFRWKEQVKCFSFILTPPPRGASGEGGVRVRDV